MSDHRPPAPDAEFSVAVIGLAARFPGAPTAAAFWDNLLAGRDSLTLLGDEEYLAAGGDPALLDDPYHVRAVREIDGHDRFDADHFGYRPAEAALLDPQQRVFLEVAHHAFEDSGYVPARHPGPVGVYAGAAVSRYYAVNLAPWYAGLPGSLDQMAALSGNSPGTLPTRVSYLLGLTGPSISVQTACSTSLVAVHLACQDLLAHRCDLALAGGVALNPHARLGYRHVKDGPYSPDGRVRAFDAEAVGMSQGDGAGAVVLKRLQDALADGDTIRAVILGTAVNNDGSRKAGFTAPSAHGQTEVILAALAEAGVEAGGIGYVEAHGTGTPVGDPIELTALRDAFDRAGGHPGECLIGSVKTNIGHLDAAAGIAGLIKVVLALEHGIIPATLHHRRPNPLFDWESAPFRPAVQAGPWRVPGPRRAGVSSFGIGGTNAHAILEQPPAPEPPGRAPGAGETPYTLLTLSARTPAALDTLARDLAAHLDAHPELDPADVAYTLSAGRAAYPLRRTLVVREPGEAAEALRAAPRTPPRPAAERPLALLLPGGGAHYDGMGAGLYAHEPVFRDVIDECARIMLPVLGHDLRTALYGPPGDGAAGPERPGEHTARLDGVATGLRSAAFPAVVATEYALARLLESHGLGPVAMLGHSLGEYAAACLAGVIALEDVLPLVAERERLFASVGGATLSVRLAPDDLEPLLGPDAAVAAVNAGEACTVSGTTEAIVALEKRLAEAGVDHHRLRVPSAVHTPLLDPVLEEYRALVAGLPLKAPRIPYVSNVTGTWITAEQAADPGYWVRHSREPVRFADGVRTLCADDPAPLLVEAGPGGQLSKLARQVLGPDAAVVPAMRHAYAEQSDEAFFLEAVGSLWRYGADAAAGVWRLTGRRGRRPRRVPLPGYPFQRRRFWIDPPPRGGAPAGGPVLATDDIPADTVPAGGAVPAGAVPADAAETAGAAARREPQAAAPGDPVRQVTALWERALGVEGIGPDDNFFDLGGDSLLLMRLTAQVRDLLGADLSVRRLFLNQRLTVAGFLAEAAETTAAAGGSAPDPAPAGGVPDPAAAGGMPDPAAPTGKDRR
ncbi:acyl transferase domain-containing protein [Thermocatellispora tengchongensis]|uniref:Acyl transferase domain-containing protein n=1 Tax=Thermocatellispora tengchongensis TaxID=1073253 RepID=A0A840P1Z2_9ACTN|nr:type I polyketide synthase [Thermocatellispora tengchongensis]MBB5133708.1 acyl transferase domain-containing protein [Thermocatellispora tengchongensis]